MNKTKNKKSSIKDRLETLAIGTGLGLAVCAILMLVSAALISNGTLEQKTTDAIILACVLLGAAVSGAYVAGRSNGGVVVAGLKSAAVIGVILLLGTMLNTGKSSGDALTIRLLIAAAVGGTFGGVLKLHRNGNKTRHRR